MTMLEDTPGVSGAAAERLQDGQPVAKPMIAGHKSPVEQVLLYVFVVVPFLALLAAVPYAWGWGIGWTDVAIAVAFYAVSGMGITVGFHRYFTHGASRPTGGSRSRWRWPARWPSRAR